MRFLDNFFAQKNKELGAFYDEKFEEGDENNDEEADAEVNRAEGASDQEEARGGGEGGTIAVIFAAEIYAVKRETIKELHKLYDQAESNRVDCCKK